MVYTYKSIIIVTSCFANPPRHLPSIFPIKSTENIIKAFMKLSFFYFLIRLLTFSGICSQKLSPKNKKNLMIFQTIKPGKKLFHKCIPCNEIPFVPIFAVVKFFFPNKRPVANHILKTLSKRKICLVFPYIENRRSVVTSSDEAIAKYFCHIIGKSRIFFSGVDVVKIF